MSVFMIMSFLVMVFFFKQKTAYEVRSSYWSSDVCSSDLLFGLRTIAIEIHSAIIMLYKYRADQCGQLVDRLGVTRRLLPYRPALGRRVRERLAPHYRRGQHLDPLNVADHFQGGLIVGPLRVRAV